MSTRSYISIKVDEKEYHTVYCHHDGYLSGVGQTLLDFYNTKEKIEELISYGGMSYLEESIEKPEGHSYEYPTKGYTVFYARDRGESIEKNKAKITKKQPNFKNSWIEFIYLYKDNQWYVKSVYCNERFKKLTQKLIDREENE